MTIFDLTREQLLAPLQRVFGAVETRGHLPILNCVLLRADADGLTLTATDTEMQLRAHSEVAGLPALACCVQARKLVDILKSLPSGAALRLKLEQERLTLGCQRSRFQLSVLPAVHFPVFAADAVAAEYRVEPSRLRLALQQVAPCMAVSDVRYYLNGARLRLEAERLEAVGSDGHRLARQQVALAEPSLQQGEAILPRKAVLELLKLLPEEPAAEAASLSLGDHSLGLCLPGLQFATKLIDGRFPDVERILPTEFEADLVTPRRPLIDALRRVAILAGEQRNMRLTLADGLLQLAGSNPEAEESADALEVDCDGALHVGFNAAYLLDALGAIGTDQVRWRLNSGTASLLHPPGEDPDGFYLVMPVRL